MNDASEEAVSLEALEKCFEGKEGVMSFEELVSAVGACMGGEG